MEAYFGRPQFDENGVKVITRVDGPYADMLMNITVYQIKKGKSITLFLEMEETAILLISGAVTFGWQNQSASAVREDTFRDGAACLHVPKGIPVTVEADKDSEVLVQSAVNETVFDSVLYTPETCEAKIFGLGQFEGKAQRTVRTFFDVHNAPYSNLVIGELLAPQGGWSSYAPHSHEQPEVYYYRFDKPQGFGACFVGDEVYKISDGSFAAIPGGLTHPQVNAPGYPMYYVWMIRNFEGNPWTERNFDPDHVWLME